MRVIAQQWVSADGYAAGPNGEQDVFAGVGDFGPAETYNRQLLEGVDEVLLGRRTYESFVKVWPEAGEPMAEWVNRVPKAVFSRTLTVAPWGEFVPARVEPDAEAYLRRRRRTGDATLLIWGSLALMRSLLASRQLDELDLLIAPIALGSGIPLVAPGGPYRLDQVETDVWPSSLHVRYAIDYGSATPHE